MRLCDLQNVFISESAINGMYSGADNLGSNSDLGGSQQREGITMGGGEGAAGQTTGAVLMRTCSYDKGDIARDPCFLPISAYLNSAQGSGWQMSHGQPNQTTRHL